MLKILVAYFLVISSFILRSQNLIIEPFARNYVQIGNQRIMDFTELDTSLLILGSNSYDGSSSVELLNVDKKGGSILSSNILMGKSGEKWNPFQLFKDNEENFWVVSENEFTDHSHTHLIKIDQDNEVELDFLLGDDSTYQRMNYMVEYANNFYLAGTYSSPSMSYGNDFWIVKMNKEGDVIWNNHFGIDSINEVASSLQIIEDKIYVFGDKHKPNFVYNPYVITLDTNGNFISDTPLDWDYNGGVKKSCITDDAIYVVGESATPTSSWFDIYLAKYDLEGNRLWRKLVNGSDESETGFDVQNYQNKLFITGYAHNFNTGNKDMHSTIVDTSGNILSQKMYNYGNVDIGFRILPTDKGGFYVGGDGTGVNDNDYFLVYDTTSLLEVTYNSISNEVVNEFTISSNPGLNPKISFQSGHDFEIIEIYNLDGKIFFRDKIHDENEIILPNLNRGLYSVKLIGHKLIKTEKIIIQ